MSQQRWSLHAHEIIFSKSIMGWLLLIHINESKFPSASDPWDNWPFSVDWMIGSDGAVWHFFLQRADLHFNTLKYTEIFSSLDWNENVVYFKQCLFYTMSCRCSYFWHSDRHHGTKMSYDECSHILPYLLPWNCMNLKLHIEWNCITKNKCPQ